MRYETPYSDLHAVDLLTTVDDLVQQRRLVPGELKPLLGLMGVGTVVTGTDDDISRSGAIDPAAAAPVLSRQLGTPTRRYGPVRSYPRRPAATSEPTLRCPRCAATASPGARGIVHVDPAGPATIVDGGAQSLADMAAFGALPSTDPILYAGDMNKTTARREAAAGANLVVGDSNRRREFLSQSTQQNLGATLGQNQPLATGAAVINPFSAAGANGQTVSVLRWRALPAGSEHPGRAAVPRERPDRGVRRRHLDRMGGRPPRGSVRALDRGWLQRAARRALRRRRPAQRCPRRRHRGRRQRRAPRGRPGLHTDPRQPPPRQRGCGSRSTTSTSRRLGSAVPAASGRSAFPASTSGSCCARPC